ncbi:MAG TPA: hypothetical protein VKQ89_07020 [Candidatus Angelobacter sp.]|nr:hypothetical protein [Candidatus Angelobacter sp.]
MSLPQLLLAALSLAMFGILLVVMVLRNLRTKYPLFFVFLSINSIALLMNAAVYQFAFQQYFYIFWSLNTLVMLVGFGVMYEVFVTMLKPYSAVIDLAKTLFIWAAAFLLAAGFLTALVTSGPSSNKLVVAVDLCDRCVHMMQCGLLLLILLLEKRLNFSWRSSAMSIALGLGFSAALDLVVSYGQSRNPAATFTWDMAFGVAFLGVLGFWAFALNATEPSRNTISDPPTRLILQRWNEALIGYGYGDRALASGPLDSFLPGVEQTVDRVLARKMVQ